MDRGPNVRTATFPSPIPRTGRDVEPDSSHVGNDEGRSIPPVLPMDLAGKRQPARRRVTLLRERLGGSIRGYRPRQIGDSHAPYSRLVRRPPPLGEDGDMLVIRDDHHALLLNGPCLWVMR